MHGTAPKANAAWWRKKIAANVVRDRATDARLEETGWVVVRVWEHEPLTSAEATVFEAVRARREGQSAP